MKPELKEILIAWQKAHEQVEDNASLSIRFEGKFSELCGARMNVVSVTDSMLYSLPVNGEDYPEELTRHLKSNADKGCMSCWISSFIGRNHPECNEKIREWFDSKEQLLMYIEVVLR